MINSIEVKNFKSLHYINQTLGKFHVLIGPNASGKTTFMDVINFLADIVKNGIDEAVFSRSSNYNDLTFSSQGGDIEIAVEVNLPNDVSSTLDNRFDQVRYEIRIGLTENTHEHAIKEERVLLENKVSEQQDLETTNEARELFPEYSSRSKRVINKKHKGRSGEAYQLVIRKKPEGNDNFYDENYKRSGKGWMPSFKLGIKKSALGNLPADETKFPASTWLKGFLTEGIQLFMLDSTNIQQASPPGQGKKFKTDGSNMPWVIEELKKDTESFENWILHVQSAMPEILNIDTVERPEDKHRYMRIHYQNGIKVPSWLVSDGTLRFLALTLPAYLPDFRGLYLIEEPENGIHPKALESVLQSLSSVYNAQILIASHSTVLLSLLDENDVLCFAKTRSGVTDIVLGPEHPKLKNWRKDPNLGILFSSGVLG